MAEDSDPKTVDERSPSPGSASHPSESHRLAHFELLEEIGRGGMGVVYRARDTRLGRQVAIKLLPVAFAGDPDRRSRFLREARAAAQLNHPNIATLYEVGEAEWTPPTEAVGAQESASEEEPSEAQTELAPRRVIFLAMEYVQGQDLGPRLEGDGLTLKETLSYGIQISEALAAAHAAGVIHRDLKPQNLRITPEGRIKILDFGLAKLVQEGTVVDEPLLTAHGAIVGTAPYMAPEQLQGASEVDSRCDLFSFGVVLYQMLTGRLPFEAPRLVDYVKALTHQTPEPPSRSNPEVSPQLEQVVERLLAKEPEDRYGSALEVGNALKAIARGGSIEPPPSKTRPGDSIFGEVLQPFRRPWVGWVVGAVFLMVLLGVWWSRSPSPAPGSEGTETVKMIHLPPFENVTSDTAKDQVCRGLGLALATAFQEVPVVVVKEADKAEDLGVAMRLEGSCQRLAEESASVLLSLFDRETGVMVWSRAVEAPMERLIPEMTWKVAEALDVAVLPEVRERLNRSPARSVTALTHYFRGLERHDRFDDEAALEEAVAQFREALRLEPDFALAWVGLSEALRRLVLQFNREELTEEAEASARQALALDPDLPAGLLALAKSHMVQGRLNSALAELESLKDRQPTNLDLDLRIAEVLFREGRIEEAVRGLEEALMASDIATEDSWRYWNQLGTYLRELGEYEAAYEVFLHAKELAPDTVISPKENLIGTALSQGHLEEAMGWLESLPLGKESVGLALHLGNVYYGRGEFTQAVSAYTEAIRLQPEEPMGYASRGDARARLGEQAAAHEDYRQAADAIMQQIRLDAENPTLKSRRAMYLAKAGECNEARHQAEALRSRVPSTPEFLLRFAQIHAVCGPRSDASEYLTEAVRAGLSSRRACQEPELADLCKALDFNR